MGLVPRHWLRPTYGQISVNAFCCPPSHVPPPPQSHSDIEVILHSPPPVSISRNGRSCASERGSSYNSRAKDFSADVVPTESYLLSESNKLSRIKSEPPCTRAFLQEEPRPVSWKRNHREDTVYGVSSESRRNGIIALLYSTTLFSSPRPSYHLPLTIQKGRERKRDPLESVFRDRKELSTDIALPFPSAILALEHRITR